MLFNHKWKTNSISIKTQNQFRYTVNHRRITIYQYEEHQKKISTTMETQSLEENNYFWKVTAKAILISSSKFTNIKSKLIITKKKFKIQRLN